MTTSLPAAKVDRTTTTPFYLKLFYRTGSFHRTDEFTDPLSLPPHLQIYTWPSCSLLELSHLLVSALPTLLPSPSIGTRLCFRLIFPDTSNARGNNAVVGPARYLSKDLGTLVIGDGAGVLDENGEGDGLTGADVGGEPEKTLGDARFVIGDYVSVAVMDPLPNGGVAPPPTGPSSRGSFGMGGRGDFGGGRGRENGFGNAGGFRPPRGGRGGGGFGGGYVPQGEWRRGERLPDGPAAAGGGRGRGFGGGFGGGRGGRY